MLTLSVNCLLNFHFSAYVDLHKFLWCSFIVRYMFLCWFNISLLAYKNSCYMVHWLGIATANAKRQCSLKLLVRGFFQSAWGCYKPKYKVFFYILCLAKQFTHEQYAHSNYISDMYNVLNDYDRRFILYISHKKCQIKSEELNVFYFLHLISDIFAASCLSAVLLFHCFFCTSATTTYHL